MGIAKSPIPTWLPCSIQAERTARNIEPAPDQGSTRGTLSVSEIYPPSGDAGLVASAGAAIIATIKL
ncbi:MAG: hypothetical protein R2735_15795 [Microthrixaceae bacterium]